MRPLRLEVEGLTSFHDRTVVDFAPLQLFAITGPTGAGKSSLLDAILLALFGQVPRVPSRDFKKMITDGRDQLAVRLDFETAGRRYRIARRIKLKGQGQVQLERVDGDRIEPLADRVTDADAEIERILGIGYDAFVRSVVLPQGQFDAFLRGDAKDRRAMLERLLGLSLYKRMGEVAGERHRERQQRLLALDDRLARDFADATAERLAGLQAQLAGAEADVARLQQRLRRLRALEPPATAARDAAGACEGAERAVAAAERAVADAEAGAQRQQHDSAAFAAATTRLERELAACPTAPERQQQLAAVLPLLPVLERTTAAAAQHRDDAARAAAAVAAAERELQRAEAALPQLESALAEHQDRCQHAIAELDRLRQEHAALHLRETLAPGRPCPVCTQVVRDVPPRGAMDFAASERKRDRAANDLAAATRLRDDAERTVRERARALPELQRAAAAAARLVETGEVEHALLAAQLDAAGVDAAARADVAALARRLQGEQRELQQATARAQQLRGELDRLVADERERSERLAATAAQLGLLREQLRERHAAHERAADAAAAAASALADAIATAGEAPFAAADGLAELRRRAEPLAGEHEGAVRRAAGLAQQVAATTAAIERAAELRAEQSALRGETALARELAQLLQGNRFQAFVQEEILRLLTEDASARLLALSAGRYALRHEENDFLVVDHWNADRARSARTLSGGETFQASLALSLALAERIATLAAGGRPARALECLFVDEGFGALDPEALEAAVQALEALHGGERMVGVITHLPELAERLPARLVVTNRGGRATVELQ